MGDLKTLHHWDVLALSCIDGRFIKKTVDWVAKQTNGVFDYRTEVGSSKAIIDHPADRARFFVGIDAAMRLHDVNQVWLIDHVDCGAYGGSKKFADIEEEKAFHKEQLEKAARIVKDHYPTIKVKMIFVDWDNIEEL